MTAWLDLHAEFPGLRGNRIHVLDAAVEQSLRTALSARGFELYTIDGSKILDESTFFDEASRALGFPAYFGRNWDALIDCLGDFEHRSARRVVIVWKEADQTLAADAQTFLDAVRLFDVVAADLGTHREDGSEPLQMEMFILGRGKGFSIALKLDQGSRG